MAFCIGVDIGGTFTDTTILRHDGSYEICKTPTTPSAPELGVLQGILAGIGRAEANPADCTELVISATVGLNSIIQRRGARVGLLVTAGFEDILELGRIKMVDVFSLDEVRRQPLVSKDWVRGVDERVSPSGRILRQLDEGSLMRGARDLIGQGAESLAVLFLHSYRNSAHEDAAKKLLSHEFPDVNIATSSEVWPQVREFERGTVLVMNSYIAPKVNGYLQSLAVKKRDARLNCPMYVSASNGGLVPVAQAIEKPVSTLFSGPSAGVVASVQLMRASGIEKAITFDMGGTSADIAVLDRAEIPYAWGQEIEGLPVAVPYVDVSSIGSGGGSIAYLDNVGVLHVGPEGAGADPGPAAYGRGGTRPTVTDAYLICGFIDPANFAGGDVILDVDLARQAIQPLADNLGLSVENVAAGIIRVTTSVQVAEFSRLAAKKGVDYRQFTLIAFGGAGPTHASLLADELHIKKILVPRAPGTFCALGSVLADFRLDYVKVEYAELARIVEGDVERWFDSVAAQARQTLQVVEGNILDFTVHKTVEVRYRSQGFEVSIPFEQLERVPERFRQEYQKLYGSRQDDATIEITSFRATVVGRRQVPGMRKLARASDSPAIRKRRIRLGRTTHEAAAYRRADLGPGWRAKGPFVIDQADTTSVVTPGWEATVDEFGSLHVQKVN